MNNLLKPYLQKFVLVFFDDILIYSRTWDNHLLHVENVLHLLQENKFFVKKIKFSFGANEVEYLGNIVRNDGLKLDPQKIQYMQEWSLPTTLKHLKGFLGLTSYYRKIFNLCGKFAKPFTNLLKKNAFHCTHVVEKSFKELKRYM
jgi:hypothetical protein